MGSKPSSGFENQNVEIFLEHLIHLITNCRMQYNPFWEKSKYSGKKERKKGKNNKIM